MTRISPSEPTSGSPVRSHNEWDPLEEVIVGSVAGAAQMGVEPALSPYLISPEHHRHYRPGPRPAAEIDAAEEQLDNLQRLLEERGITVRRPDPVDYRRTVKTPDFEVPCGNSSACPRDVLLVIGDEIIEAAMAQRGRFFEYRAYRSVVTDYFRRGARWSAAPKPRMADNLYTTGYSILERPFDADEHPFLTDVEPCFDAASFLRMGRDIFYQPDVVTNDMGAAWLQRHLGDDYRLRRVRFADRHPPQHIDTTLVPIRPGLALTNPERSCVDETFTFVRANGWELVEAPPSVQEVDFHSPDVSNWISMNVLCLDPETVLVEEMEEPMIRLLESLGSQVITCPFTAVYPFGGGIHCCTSDVRRRGELLSYFPLR